MIENKAFLILHNGFQNLINRNGSLNLGDVETEVINQACRYIIETSDRLATVHDVSQIGNVITANMVHYQTASAFTSAAARLFPEHYREDEINTGIAGIMSNISWAGMWDFLRDYFQKNHGEAIDNKVNEPTIFYSVHHERFEGRLPVKPVDVERNINIVFMDDRQDVIVSIEPTLSPKKARLVNKADDVYSYRGYDPDYLFHIHFNHFDEVERFVLELPNRSIKLVYT
ncbi:hypothetical protein C8N47_105139 [Mangrovibacterium marinum]|uniref:Uncharacterized protein n=1 Tax=Mangrovibacterium marinum TaxID=1639118 RepID=A0A2T5C3F0_9BACT|nr:hypothetical protein [Mangrovibacterium marinum]PTN09298.1 hypothetical protein C8N47_105139 [Mangrovibacterium marinum]